MKNLLVPAAIAIGGLFMVTHLENADSVNGVSPSNGKHDHARHHRHIANQVITASEVPVNAVKVSSFASIAETIMPSFFIDFSDGQTAVSDNEINNQMEENLVVISLQDATNGDIEIIEQMQKSLVKIETPVLQNADQYIEHQFAQEEANTIKYVAVEETKMADKEINDLFENAIN